MDIGIGIPNTVPGATGSLLLDWARRADAAGFSTLSTIGAVSYPGFEELTVFAAAGAVTERIRFMPNVLLAPTRSAAELAKQATTVDQVSGGRLTLGLGVGWRTTDYELTGRDFHRRGQSFDGLLRDLHRAWSEEPLVDGTRAVAPPTVQRPGIPIVVGGRAEVTPRRVAEFGVGWTAGGMPPEAVADMAQRVRAAWEEAGRDGEPRIVTRAYFSLGDTVEDSRRYLLDYYGLRGPEVAEAIAASALRSPDMITDAIDGYAEAGADELLIDPTVADLEQVELLADVVF